MTKSIQSTVRDRLRNIFQGQKRRARKLGLRMDYEFEDLWKLVVPLGKCPYCERKLTPKTFSLDHKFPLARGGQFTLDNLQVACGSCNRRKHALLDGEYRMLLAFLATRSEYMRMNILMRLAAGGAWLQAKGLT